MQGPRFPATLDCIVALPDLPILDVVDDVRSALASFGRVVVSAPPGAGKTTVVPLALLDQPWRGDGRIVVLEPRRLAARAAARRMADLVGSPVGGLVGYQTRDERRIGPDTRIEVLTEGVLTRRLQRDPELPGVAAVLFDEVHERNLTTDVGLAFTLDVADALRPDLRIAAMSATADTAAFAALLAAEGVAAPVVASEGRMFAVDVRWLPRPRRGRNERLDDAVGSAVETAVRDDEGDILVFLPGIGEIQRIRRRLENSLPHHVDVRPLAGALSLEDQDLALRPSPAGRRRVVLATDIAETSLTVDGVRVVVDSGQARRPRFDAGTGMTRLVTVGISRDSADQRTGRAGRTEPGVCYRLWSRIEHGSRPARRTAEMLDVDLSGLALELAAWGSPPQSLRFADAPPARAWAEGVELLRLLGALEPAGPHGDDDDRESVRRPRPPDLQLTEIGRQMVNLPLHPRLARMVAAAPMTAACVVAAVVDDRDVMRGRPDELPADLALRVGLVCGRITDDRADRGAVRRVRDRAGDLARRVGAVFDLDTVDADRSGLLLLAGFPDRLAARRRPGQFQLRTGSGAFVNPDDPLATVDFLVAADLDGKRSGARIRLGAAIEGYEIAGLLDDVVERELVEWDADRDDLVVRVERRLDALRLDETVRRAVPSPVTTAALLARVRSTRLGVVRPTGTADQLRARVAFLRNEVGEPWPDWSDEALLRTLDEWLGPHLVGATGRADLERVDIATVLRSGLVWPLGRDLDVSAPAALTLPTGRDTTIDYAAPRPTVSVRVQDVFGLTTHPTVADGRVPITMSLLSPANRPVQVTADLPGFWSGSWADVRKELAGRYPKHRWPDDPAHEHPGRR